MDWKVWLVGEALVSLGEGPDHRTVQRSGTGLGGRSGVAAEQTEGVLGGRGRIEEGGAENQHLWHWSPPQSPG